MRAQIQPTPNSANLFNFEPMGKMASIAMGATVVGTAAFLGVLAYTVFARMSNLDKELKRVNARLNDEYCSVEDMYDVLDYHQGAASDDSMSGAATREGTPTSESVSADEDADEE